MSMKLVSGSFSSGSSDEFDLNRGFFLFLFKPRLLFPIIRQACIYLSDWYTFQILAGFKKGDKKLVAVFYLCLFQWKSLCFILV